MHGRAIFLVASLVTPIFASPVPINDIVPRENFVLGRRSEFSISGFLRDIIKREPLVEALPAETSYAVIEEVKRSATGEGADDEDDAEVDFTDEVLEERKVVNNPGGGPSKRKVVNNPGGGPSKRKVVNNPGGGPSKRKVVNNPGGGPSKRKVVNNPGGGPSKRKVVNNPGGGPSKRKVVNNPGGGPSKRKVVNNPGGGPSK